MSTLKNKEKVVSMPVIMLYENTGAIAMVQRNRSISQRLEPKNFPARLPIILYRNNRDRTAQKNEDKRSVADNPNN
jgi:hypothetical protein